MDGSCNNEQRPEWGQINVALQRIIPPKYGDGDAFKIYFLFRIY